ncbi:MAG: Gfo/Idh/MocA family oxidoreductase [bacterium]|nr:Gfo/Idh/MocA family oxidoreductase [bacterium]MDE0289684.1 Gfo/Idh/MocA family oxidoreductase [bacterium]MDE0440206.1 Gfo/Idh/MocA family oxidoreductase [bacterium]
MTALRTAVVGVGAIGSLHARIYQEHPLAELVGVVDVDEGKARAVAEPLGVPWFTEVSDLLGSCEFTAASVAVPEHYRHGVAVPLAQAGKHLLLEKPLAPSLAETDRLIADIEETGVIAMVNFILRFDPRYSEAYQAASSGRLGDIHTIFVRRRGSWLGAEIYGVWTDLLISTGIHDLDVMAWLAGSPVVRVYAETISRRSAAHGHDDAAMVLVRFENGIIGSLETSWVLPPSIPAPLDASLQVVGTEGGVFVDGSNHGLTMVDADRMTLPDLAHWPVTRGRVSGDLAASLDHFIRSVREETQPEMTLGAARLAHAIVDAAKRSAGANRPVPLTPPR